MEAIKMNTDRSAAYRSSMRAVVSGVMIISGRDHDDSSGMTATAVVSLSDDPPLIGIAINKQASVHDLIKGSGLLGINVLSQQHANIARIFADRCNVHGAHRFESGTWRTHAVGLKILDDAASVLIGSVVDVIDCATHSFFVANVVDCSVREGSRPLLYHDGQFGCIGSLVVAEH
jgi:flavin reductase